MATLLIGCASPSRSVPVAPPKPKEEEPKRLQTGSGRAERLRDDGTPAYRVDFVESQLEFDQRGVFAGAMRQVTGEIFGKSAKSTTFSADAGMARKEDERLELNGNIRLVSPDPKGTLTCEHLVWNAAAQRVQAYGNVRFEGEAFTLGPASEVWASPDLSVIGTPTMFLAPKPTP
jgi:hypothetical protein